MKLKANIVPDDITINRPERYMVKISPMKLKEVEQELSKYKLSQPIWYLVYKEMVSWAREIKNKDPIT